ncbi:MAG: VanZ family protein [Haloferacaceae archaeon]
MSPDATDERGRWLGVAVSALSLLVGSALPLPPRHNPDFGPYGPDKLLHLLGHAGLAAALVAALDDGGPSVRGAVAAVVASTVYGVGTELLQEQIPGREFERGDVAAGLVGSLLGVGLWRRVASTNSTARSRQRRHGSPGGERARDPEG